jgi:SAM-dependent methyltransferase
MDKTVGYYNDKAQEFFESTVNVDMSEHYRVFLNLLPPGGRILDAGCGSGRDSFHFINLGFQVTAIDASPVLAELSSKLMGQPVAVLRFQDLDFEKEYGDGEGERNGRFFNDYNEQSFGCLLSDHPSLRLVSSWVSGDVRPERAGEKWLNVVVRRIENT